MHVQKRAAQKNRRKPADVVPPEMRAAPLAGAPLQNHVRPGYQACTFFVSQAGRYRSCLA
jgi:hypothetical protein